MASTIPDLWSDDIRADVLPPVAILRVQANLLGRKTQGLLEAELTTLEASSGAREAFQHNLDLVAPTLKYRERLLTAKHEKNLIYPVTVAARCFAPKPTTIGEVITEHVQFGRLRASNERDAATQDEFIDLVREVLHSPEVRSAIQSLIARSNEMLSAQAGEPKSNGSAASDQSPDRAQ